MSVIWEPYYTGQFFTGILLQGVNSFRIALARAAVHLRGAQTGDSCMLCQLGTVGGLHDAAKYTSAAAGATKMSAEEVERLHHAAAAAPSQQRPVLLQTSKHNLSGGADNIHHAQCVPSHL
jgi:hypothetical protein